MISDKISGIDQKGCVDRDNNVYLERHWMKDGCHKWMLLGQNFNTENYDDKPTELDIKEFVKKFGDDK